MDDPVQPSVTNVAQHLIRNPVEGRRRIGGLHVGEMEKNALRRQLVVVQGDIEKLRQAIAILEKAHGRDVAELESARVLLAFGDGLFAEPRTSIN